ncbi:mitochondrial-processing peptidase subunit alpha [Lingula anatina]|uniref:Mitochondrial-processing peptidase subunit alpha n=1 Tax=Lingula anatina TaxID=7574 RepID=A0A1S3KBI1_LINAN|nr:mitochondrial-processing peptidase subunit alpha [Lingula anatina]|eukprot:XP_013419990.1 mitochondrial-processing peptidase subunit alpha [Lingula anatina]
MASARMVNLFSRWPRICGQIKSNHPSVQIQRLFCNENQSEKLPLSERLPGLPNVRYAVASKERHETKVTTLENGLRVASEKSFGDCCTFGIVIDSGSRYEVAYPSGVVHFLEKLAFHSTTKYSDNNAIQEVVEPHGGMIDCQAQRDCLMYASSISLKGIEDGMDVISEAVLRPKLEDAEIEEARQAVAYELNLLDTDPDMTMNIMNELIHASAYRDNTVGLPRYCSPDNINKIDKKILYTFMKNYHTPDRMVLSGAGIDHDLLVDLAKKYFTKTPIWEEDAKLIDPTLGRDGSLSQYTGGMIKVDKDLADVRNGPNPMPQGELAHVAIALETCSWHDEDYIPFSVLAMMLGGGGSFSVGGPGKGMYSRLYLNVLNRYYWVNFCQALNVTYDDTGFFTITANAHPSHLGDLVQIVQNELCKTAGKITVNAYGNELERAKIQLKSLLLGHLELRPVVFEDIARQVLASGERKSAEWYIEKIGAVTEEDIQRVANRMLRTQPAVAAMGNLEQLPSYDKIANALVKGYSRKFLGGKISLFS